MDSFLKSIDFVTQLPHFYYDQNKSYKTKLGGLLQIFVTVSWIAGIMFFSKDIYLRENPSVISSNEYDRIPYERNFTNMEDYMVMIALNDPLTWGPFIDETLYTVKFTTASKINQVKGPIENLKTVKCSMDMFKGKENFTLGIPIENYYCLSPDIKKIAYKGTQTSPDSKYIKIGVHMCINSTLNNNTCRSKEEITNKLSGSSFNLFFFNNKFETKSFNKPNELFLDFHHSFYSNLYYKLVFVVLKQVRFIDDIGFFFESLDFKDYYAVNDIKEVFHFQEQADGKFLDFAILFGTNRENIRRNYKRIQTVIAEVGGLFKGLIIFILIIQKLIMDDYLFEYINYFISYSKNIPYENLQNDKSNFNLMNKYQLSSEGNSNLINKLNNINVNLNLNENKNNDGKLQENKPNKENCVNNLTIIRKNIENLAIKNGDLANFDCLVKNNRKQEFNSKINSKNIENLVTNYFNQREIMKLLTDFTLLRSVLFDTEQNRKFEEMSRNLDLIMNVMQEKEVIFGNILMKKENSSQNVNYFNYNNLNIKKSEK